MGISASPSDSEAARKMKEAKRSLTEVGKDNCSSRWLLRGGKSLDLNLFWCLCRFGFARPLGQTSEKLLSPSPSDDLRPRVQELRWSS